MSDTTPNAVMASSNWHRETLGVSSSGSHCKCKTLTSGIRARREIALALWCNSTLGLMLNANHSNRSQAGRGRGNKGMLETLITLDARKLEAWQLEEAQAIWRDFSGRKFQSFHQCAVDPARIELDERLVRDILGLDEAAVATVGRLRTLLATDPSIHGSKKPALP